MESQEYSIMAELQRDHWWFVARRQIVGAALARLELEPKAQILEVGCGMGGNLAMLAQLGDVYGTDMHPQALEYSTALGVAKAIEAGSLPDKPAFADRKFDLAVMLDVVEHIEDDAAALAALAGQLKAGGYVVLTVPAFQFLWSHHDELAHHKRRYRKAQIQQLLEQAGFEVMRISYFNFWLFPLIAMVRIVQRFLPNRGVRESGLRRTNGLVNAIFRMVFASERWLVGRVWLPFGVSILAVARLKK